MVNFRGGNTTASGGHWMMSSGMGGYAEPVAAGANGCEAIEVLVQCLNGEGWKF